MELIEWYQKGLTANEYIELMKVNKEGMQSIYERFELDEKEKVALSPFKNNGLKVIALSEDWCGDAMINNAILLKIAEEMSMDVRFLLRDSNLELMDQYLTNGTSRSIPIYIFIDENGKEQAIWGPRANEVQQLVEEGRAKLPAKEAEDFPEKQKEFYKQLMKSFVENESLWKAVSTSIISTLTKYNLND